MCTGQLGELVQASRQARALCNKPSASKCAAAAEHISFKIWGQATQLLLTSQMKA